MSEYNISSENFEGRGKRVKILRMLTGLSRREFEEVLGISSNTMQSWEAPKKEGAGLTEKGARRVVSAISKLNIVCSYEWILTGVGNGPMLVGPMIQENQLQIPSVDWGFAESILKEIAFFKSVNQQAVVTAVTDDGMHPFFSIGDYVGGRKTVLNDYANFVGKNCIVETSEGLALVRRLLRYESSSSNVIICLNQDTRVKDYVLCNLQIASVAEVVWHRKAHC